MKSIVALITGALGCFLITAASPCFAQGESAAGDATAVDTAPADTAAARPASTANTVVAQGTVSEIAKDGSYIVVNEGGNSSKFMTNKDFIDEAHLEVGDKVKITGEKSDSGIKLIDYDYIFDDTTETPEEATAGEVAPKEPVSDKAVLPPPVVLLTSALVPVAVL